MRANRTIEGLREAIGGRIYIYLDNEKIGKRFLQDAENEGYRFGNIKPTKNGWSNVIALKDKKQLSYVGFVGHMSFQCGGGDGGSLTRVDYEKYARGDTDFLYNNKAIEEIVVNGKFLGNATIIGDNCFDAAAYLKNELEKCADDESESRLHGEVEEKYGVLIIPENEYVR